MESACKQTVYLDYAATAPLCEEAACAMAPYFVSGPGNISFGANANSLHSPGRAAFAALEGARKDLARCIGARQPAEVVFTSGATEADNMVLFGIARALRAARNGKGEAMESPRIVVSAFEHDAVLNPARRLAHEGFEVVFVRPDRTGHLSVEALDRALTGQTILVSVQTANAEVGAVQPIAELVACAHRAGALFHTDATQAFGKVPFDACGLGVDAASFSAHKIGGPKGVGALFLKSRTPFEAQLLGGGQEAARRSGTQNVAGAVGFAAAAQAACSSLAEESLRQAALRDLLYGRLCALPGVKATVPQANGSDEFLPNIVHVLVEGLESETLVLRLDAAGYCVSGGSACASHSLDPSHVLASMGISADEAYGALRISFGRYTTQADIEGFADAFRTCIGADS